MMLATYLRQAATMLMESAIRIAPPESRDWGQAMQGELYHVEGHWAALMWALGGASVLAKSALAALFIPGQPGEAIPSGAGLFAKDVPISRAALAIGGACVLAALLFFAAPPFRQALHVSLRPWYSTFRGTYDNFQPDVEALARQADRKHDAEGLAFCAMRLQNSPQSARLAEEAIRLDPSLLWVYAMVAVRHPGLPEISQWVPTLEGWDPQNALFPLITAESIDLIHANREDEKMRAGENDPAWQRAMTAAFQSPKFDDYLERLEELDRRVVSRYGVNDPAEVMSESNRTLPTYSIWDSRRFASSLIRSGEDLAARGDRKGAMEKYWTAARFGQLIDSQGHTSSEHLLGTSVQAMAYKQLQRLSPKEENQTEAALFSYLAVKFDPKSEAHVWRGGWIFGQEICQRNAAVLMASGLMFLIFSGILVVAIPVLIAGSRRSARPAVERARPMATMVVLTSGVGLLFSSVMLYLTYRPYWYIFQSAILNGDSSQARDLRAFLNSTQMVFGLDLYLSPGDRANFWWAVTSLAVAGLGFILLRHALGRARIPALRHSP
ncbi:MAG TPA: hypothetical protein VGV68_07580 [Terriglobia bacterium]|nr:hypothetical protein [Terriglobia bacterium]